MSKIEDAQFDLCTSCALALIEQLRAMEIRPEIVAMSLMTASSRFLARETDLESVGRLHRQLANDAFAEIDHSRRGKVIIN